LLGLFSIVTLLANRLARNGQLPIRQAAWYTKTQATFSDAIAAVRQQLWHPANFFTCHSKHKMVKIPHALYSGLCHAISYAA
jgi:predicted nucleic-acid-binding protein